jgi:hypothetical protein
MAATSDPYPWREISPAGSEGAERLTIGRQGMRWERDPDDEDQPEQRVDPHPPVADEPPLPETRWMSPPDLAEVRGTDEPPLPEDRATEEPDPAEALPPPVVETRSPRPSIVTVSSAAPRPHRRWRAALVLSLLVMVIGVAIAAVIAVALVVISLAVRSAG